ncbi:LsmAD domain containing protein [Nitzschia inconspicua]|uniref:LsmAD domain containing protein n=1 Tax=Nitzschia inconspicua TaxID=303405 RepID=A0A9K3PJ99_9STRA|nr:LsmAD domain containing protein [Nitzschia inconspicua]
MSNKSQSTGVGIAASNGKKAPSPANAWSRPLQSKRPAGPPPGMGPPTVKAAAVSAPSASVLIQNRERLLHLSLTLIGQKVVLEQTDGAIVEGIFHTFTPFNNLPAENKNKYVLKEIRVQRPPTANNGSSGVLKDGGTLIVSTSKVLYLHAKHVDLDRPDRSLSATTNMNGTGGAVASSPSSGDAFATDTQISGSRGGRDRDLVAAGSSWTSAVSNGDASTFRGQALNAPLQTNSRAAALGGPKSNNTKGPGATNAAGKLSGSIGGWDQFKANEELFNVNASFDENLYTTQLDLDNIDAKRVAEAERIAREIESSATDNIHLAEERGQKIETDFRDEEDRYSTVLTKDGKQRHEVKNEEATNISSTGASKLPPSSSSGPKKIMNYAAAAAKADPSKKTAPDGLAGTSSPPIDSKNDDTPARSRPAPVTPEPQTKAEAQKPDATKPSEQEKSQSEPVTKEEKVEKAPDEELKVEEKKETKVEVPKTSKLNANAKEFTFNPQAKTFTPGISGGVSSSVPIVQQPLQHVGQDPTMQMYAGGHPMQPPHYMATGHMGQPGMMPMMSPQYGGMRYPPQFGRDQTMAQMQHHQGQPPQGAMPPSASSGPGNAVSTSSSPTNANDGEGTPSHDDSSHPSSAQQQHQRSQHQPPDQQGLPHQQLSMPYGVPPGAYFPGAMGMPRPGYPQFVPGPQQIQGRPGVAPYGVFPMQPGGIPPNMQMRGPNGAPYYPGPNGPMPFPPGAYMGHAMMDDGGGDPNYRGGRGRGPAPGRGGRGRGRGGRGRGRGSYNNNQNSSGNNSGRSTPQQQPQQTVSTQQQGPISSEDAPPSTPRKGDVTPKSDGET